MHTERISKKFSIVLLFLLTVFFGLNNFIWLTLNHRPPIDDEAYHLTISLQYVNIFLHPSKNIVNALLTADKTYPPLFSVTAAFFAMLFGKNTIVLCMVNVLFLLGIFLCMYRIGVAVGDRRLGILASCLLGLYPMFFHLSRMFMFEIALCFTVTATILSLLYTEGFTNTRMSIWTGVLLGLGLLTKQTYMAFIIGPSVYTFWQTFSAPDRKRRKKAAVNCALMWTTGFAVALPWYLSNFSVKWGNLMKAVCDPAVVPHKMAVLSAESLLYYGWALVKHQVFPFYSCVFVVSLILLLPKIKKYLLFLIWIIVPYLVLSFVPNKFYYYTFASLPAIAFISSIGVLQINNRLLKILAVLIVTATGIYGFFSFSYCNYQDRPLMLYHLSYSPQDGRYGMEEMIAGIVEGADGGRLILGVYGIDGNEINSEDDTVGENFTLANYDGLKYHRALKGLWYDLVCLRTEKDEAIKNSVNFIISYDTLENIRVTGLRKENYSLFDILDMPDFTKVYVYTRGRNPRNNQAALPFMQPRNVLKSANGDIHVELKKGKWKLFWKEKEITQSSAMNTSFRCLGNWYNSLRASKWEVEKLNENEIRATEYFGVMPVSQIWHLTTDKNRLSIKVETHSESVFPLDYESIQLMASDKYTNWETPQRAGSFLQKSDHDRPKVLHTFKPRSGPGVYMEASAEDNGLPDVFFYCLSPIKNMHGTIANPQDMFKGRLLEYIVKHRPWYLSPRGTSKSFQGYIIIE